MLPVPEPGDQSVFTRSQSFERVFCLSASQMHDPGSGGNRLSSRRDCDVEKEVVVAGIGLLDTGGSDLHSMSLQHDPHVRAGDRGAVRRLADLDAAGF